MNVYSDVCVTFADNPGAVFAEAARRQWVELPKVQQEQFLRGVSGGAWAIIQPGERNRILFVYRVSGSCSVFYEDTDPIEVERNLIEVFGAEEFERPSINSKNVTKYHRILKNDTVLGMGTHLISLEPGRVSADLNFFSLTLMRATSKALIKKLEAR